VILLNQSKNNETLSIIKTENRARIIIENKNIDQINLEIIKRNNIADEYSQKVGQWLNESRP